MFTLIQKPIEDIIEYFEPKEKLFEASAKMAQFMAQDERPLHNKSIRIGRTIYEWRNQK